MGLLATLGVSILGKILTGKGVMRAWKRVLGAGKGIVSAGRGNNNMDNMDKRYSFRSIL